MKKPVLALLTLCLVMLALHTYAEAGRAGSPGTAQSLKKTPVAVLYGPGDEEVRPLIGPEVDYCDGDPAGIVAISDLGPGGLRVRVDFVNGPANDLLTVFWNCTSIPNGCHFNACGYTGIGSIATNAAGQGSFETTLTGGNPFVGAYVHFDVGHSVPTLWYTSKWDMVFPHVGSLAASPVATPGDATR